MIVKSYNYNISLGSSRCFKCISPKIIHILIAYIITYAINTSIASYASILDAL